MLISALHQPLQIDELELQPLAEGHREGLRGCCQPNDPVWEIYPYNLSGEGFDPGFDAMLANPDRFVFAIVRDGLVVGMTSYLNVSFERQTLEIGGTFMAPDVRGSGVNARVKALLLDHAFGQGIRRVEFRIDERNLRSQRAVAKLGATKEGTLRAERITWTGHVRNTVLWSLLAGEHRR